MTEASPFHTGEQHVQERLGVRADIEPWARKVVRTYLPEEHRAFYGQLPFLVGAARDVEGRAWATLLAGAPGFATSPDPHRLAIGTRPVVGDALETSLRPGADLGLLGIELATRRRNRVNGRVAAGGGHGLVLDVDQSFGNCPQYIVEREWEAAPPDVKPRVRRAAHLSDAQQRRIAAADTFFIASGHRGEGREAAFGMDASHRGGEPGFVRVADAGHLVFPDYAGNNHFNTIGNLVVEPRVGLLFVDFERGSLLQLTGRARIDWDSPAVGEHSGARRLVHIAVDAVVEIEGALPIRWKTSGSAVRSLRVVEKIRESADVSSFVFEARDGGALPDYEPGQHLPIELEVPGESARLRRTYSLSKGPGSDRYRITVKREKLGLASRQLHDAIEPGAIVSARSPAGDFVLHPGSRPVVLVSAGVGVTPMVAMLEALTAGDDPRRVLFIHGARDGAHHPLAAEIRALAARRSDVRIHVAYSRPAAHDTPGANFHTEGRVDGALLARLAPEPDADYYVCGPARFMAEIQDSLEQRGVAPERIHSESFGPIG